MSQQEDKPKEGVFKIWNKPLYSKNVYDTEKKLSWAEITAWIVYFLFLKIIFFDLEKDWLAFFEFSFKGGARSLFLIFALLMLLAITINLINVFFKVINMFLIKKNKKKEIKKTLLSVTNIITGHTLTDNGEPAKNTKLFWLDFLYTVWFCSIFPVAILGIFFENSLLFKLIWPPFALLNLFFLVYFLSRIITNRVLLIIVVIVIMFLMWAESVA